MMKFPNLPDYKFSWRSIQVEPIPHSGERITLGAIIQGEDNALMVARLVPKTKLNSLFGKEFSSRISEALNMAIKSSETFYSGNKLHDNWIPPLDGFFASVVRESVAINIEKAVIDVARNCSCLSIPLENTATSKKPAPETFNPQTWRKEIYDQISIRSESFQQYFDKSIELSGSGGIPFRFGFISAKYAAHFDTVSVSKSHRQDSLVRAQSKLWQLDQLRDSPGLFHQDLYELVLYQPVLKGEGSYISDSIEELRNEAKRKEISLYASHSPVDAANHVIKSAA